MATFGTRGGHLRVRGRDDATIPRTIHNQQDKWYWDDAFFKGRGT